MVQENGLSRTVDKDKVVRAFQSASNDSNNNSTNEKETGFPLFTTYHPRFKDLSSLIKRTYNTFMQTKKLKKS